MSRNWCPALAAQPDALSGAAARRDPNTVIAAERPSSPKDKGAVAARNSLLGSQKGAFVLDRVHRSQTFSPKISLSTTNNRSSKANGEGKANPQQEALSSLDIEVNFPAKLEDPQEPATAKDLAPKEKKVSYAAIGHIQEALKNNDCGAHISVADIPLDTAEITTILEHENFKDVTELHAPRTLHGTHSAAAIAKALSKHDKVKALNISNNAAGFGVEEPTPEALDAVGKYVQNSKSLRQLNLSGCNLGTAGATALAPALIANGTILDLDLSANGIGLGDETAIAAVTQVLQEGKFLLSADLSHNELNGAMVKQIIDALAASDTRVATPEPEPEPEPEEYTDDLGPEEDPPTVQIGLPKEEGDDDENAPADGDDAAAAAPDATENNEDQPAADESETKAADPDDEEGEDDEEEETEEAPAATTAADADAEPEEEEDDEEREERLAREAEEREEERRIAEEAWREKMSQYVWEPERIHAEYNEGVARRKIMQAHVDETTALKKDEIAARQEAKTQQLDRERRDRERRSGWSHLQRLDLAGNPIGVEGAKALAQMLRHSIPLTEEEYEANQEKERQRIEDERAKEAAAKQAAKEAEAEARAAKKEAEREARAAARAKAEEEAAERGEELPPEKEEDEEPADEEPPAEPEEDEKEPEPIVVNVPKDRKGMRTLHTLNLSDCSITAKGLVALATTIKDNCPSLEVLNVQRNKFGCKRRTMPHPDATEDDDPPLPNIKVDVPGWVSPGVEALADALKVNRTLRVLDLSANSMFPATIRALAAGLSGSVAIQYLNLSGNKIGAEVQGAAAEEKPVLTQLLEAFHHKDCCLETLILADNELGGRLSESDCLALAQCKSVTKLSLASNNLDNTDLRLIAGSYFTICDEKIPLKTLNLDRNNIRSRAGGEAIGEIIRRCPQLREFSVRENVELGDGGFNNFVLWLVNHSNLTSLDCHRIGITTFGPLTTALPSISFLKTIDVGDNDIPEHSAKAFLEACRQSPALSSLSFWSRDVDYVRQLSNTLCGVAKACPSLTHVDLGVQLANPRSSPAEEDEELDDLELLELALLHNRLQARKGTSLMVE